MIDTVRKRSFRCVLIQWEAKTKWLMHVQPSTKKIATLINMPFSFCMLLFWDPHGQHWKSHYYMLSFPRAGPVLLPTIVHGEPRLFWSQRSTSRKQWIFNGQMVEAAHKECPTQNLQAARRVPFVPPRSAGAPHARLINGTSSFT